MTKSSTLYLPQYLTLVYHDLFDFPLTAEELEFWQVGQDAGPPHRVEERLGLYFLPGHEDIVLKRVLATPESQRKYELAKKASEVLQKIPTVEFVGITGGLAMGNIDPQDDIDLMIVTTKSCLWATRALCLLVLALKGIPTRRFGQTNIKDKLCLNLWLDTNNLKFDSRQEIYTAHEVLQIKTLFDRSEIAHRLLKENSWVKAFFPKAYFIKQRLSFDNIYQPKTFLQNLSTFFLKALEPLARMTELFYMRRKKSTETADKGKALLHPKAWNEFIPQIFLNRLEKLSKGEAPKPQGNLTTTTGIS